MVLRVGVVGAGGISAGHGEGWRKLGAEVSVHSLEFADRFAERHGATVCGSLEELFDRVDIVDVVTPTDQHEQIVKAALLAGKDVVCEKPLARTAERARELIALAESQQRRLYPAHVVRWFPQYAAAKAAVESGELGQLAVLRFTRQSQMPGRDWFADEAASGGLVMDQMIHDLDQAIWIGGDVATVFANQVIHDGQASVDQVRSCQVTLTHTSGAISHCRGLWGAAGIPFWYSFQISGTTGLLRYDSRRDHDFELTLTASADESEVGHLPSVGTFANPYHAELADFSAAIAGGAEPRVSMHDGLAAVEVAEAAIESLHSGLPVALRRSASSGTSSHSSSTSSEQEN